MTSVPSTFSAGCEAVSLGASALALCGEDLGGNLPHEPVRGAFHRGDERIRVSVGEEFVVRLEANPSTGYEWDLAFNERYLALLDRSLRQTGGPEAVGAGGVEEFRLRPEKAGQFDLHFQLRRPWEERAVDTVTFRVEAAATRQ